MSRFRIPTTTAVVLTFLLWTLIPSAHGHGGGHGGGGHGGFGHGGFGHGGFHHGFGYGYGFRGFGYGGFGYPFFGGFGYPGFGFGGLGYGLGGLGYGGLGYGMYGLGGLGYGGLGYGGLGYGGLGFRGFGFRGYGYGYGGLSGACNCCCPSAYPGYGGNAYPIYGGGAAPATGGGNALPMPRGVSSRSSYVDYYARNANPAAATATASNTSTSRYVDYYARHAAPAAENKARLRVTLPADAELWLNGRHMTRTGAEREFITPQLQQGETYAYQIKARWTQDGKPQEETIEVKVHANKTTKVALGSSALAER